MKRKIVFSSIIAIVLMCLIVPLTQGLSNYRYYTRVTVSNTTAAPITGRYVFSMNAAGMIAQGFMQADADDVRIDPEENVMYNSLVDGTGTFTGSPITLNVGPNTIDCTVAGTAVITLPNGYGGTAISGTMTVDASPVTLATGANTITTSGAIGNIVVTITYTSFTCSTVGELANTAAYWYTDYITVPAYSSVSRDIWTGNGSAAIRDQWWVADNSDVNVVAYAASLDITTNLTLSANVNLTALPVAETEIISKQGNYELAVDATDFIFRVWQTSGAPTTENLSPNAAGTITQLYNNIDGAPTANNYARVDDPPPLGAGADADYVYEGSGGSTHRDTYNITASAIPEGSIITSITVYFRHQSNTVVGGSIRSLLRLGTNETYGASIGLTNAWTNSNQTLSRPGGGSWAYSDLDGLQIGIELTSPAGNIAQCSQIYCAIVYTPPDAGHVSQIAAGTGEKHLVCTYDGVNTSITDGTTTDTDALVGALFTNAEPLDIAELDGKVDDLRIGDTLIATPTWRMDLDFEADQITGTGAATTVNDQSASNNDMTSTRTGNPAGITVTVSGMLPSSPSSVPIIGQEALITDAAKDFNPQSYTISEAGSSLTNAQVPGLIIDAASNASGVEEHWVWWFAYGLICICLFMVGMRFLGGHVTISWVMVIIATAMFVAWSVIPWWFIMIYVIFMLGSLAWENRTTV